MVTPIKHWEHLPIERDETTGINLYRRNIDENAAKLTEQSVVKFSIRPDLHLTARGKWVRGFVLFGSFGEGTFAIASHLRRKPLVLLHDVGVSRHV
jgi:hypothetical protein